MCSACTIFRQCRVLSCDEEHTGGLLKTGVHPLQLDPSGDPSRQVLVDMDSDGVGWLVGISNTVLTCA